MKKLILLLLAAGLIYGGYLYLSKVQQKTSEREEAAKPSEKILREMEKEER